MNEIVKLILAFFVAFLMAFLSTPLAERIAYKIGAIDVPKDARRMHKRPIPRLGGIAIFFGFIVSMIMFAVMTREMIAIMLAATLIVILGIFDFAKVAKILEVPEDRDVIALIPIGYPDEAPVAPRRKPVEDLLSYK